MDKEPEYTSLSALKNLCKRKWALVYTTPFQFNIVVNDMAEVQAHVPTKYHFIGGEIRDLSGVSYMSSSAPDRMCKVAQVRSARG